SSDRSLQVHEELGHVLHFLRSGVCDPVEGRPMFLSHLHSSLENRPDPNNFVIVDVRSLELLETRSELLWHLFLWLLMRLRRGRITPGYMYWFLRDGRSRVLLRRHWRLVHGDLRVHHRRNRCHGATV
ncbi:hypothetical protein PMAYCL1PPCAC_28474, partial [Pristionchus mayeri]